MVDRVTRVNLVAEVSNYKAGMVAAANATKQLEQGATKAADKVAKQHEAMSTLGPGFLAIGAIAAVGVGLAIKKFAEFDQAISEVQASTHASTGEMDQLRAAALKAGADTQYSATEAANAIDELSKAGIGTADVLGGALTGSLSLAAAGSVDVADAASIAATALTQFKLKGSDIPHVADLLAAGAGKAQGSVSDLAAALNQGGLVASQAGFNIEETTGVLAAFASAGLLGSDAGTSLKTAILALESPSTQAAGVLKQYGINVYDASGKMDSFSGIAGQLQEKLGGLTSEQRNSALATIFGTDAVRSAGVLYQQGAKGIDEWTKKVNDNGYAATTAGLKMNNLAGDIEFLKGSIDTALIQTGSAANDSLRGLVQTATFLVNAIGELPQPVLNAGLALATITAAAGGIGGGALTVVPKIAQMKGALSALGITGKAASIGIGSVTLATTALVLILGAVASANAEAAAEVEGYGNSLDATTHKVTDSTRELVKSKLALKESFLGNESDSAYDSAAKLGIGLDLVTDAALGNVDALKQVKDALNNGGGLGDPQFEARLKKSGLTAEEFAAAQGEVEQAVAGTSGSIKEAIRIAEQKASVDADSTDATKQVSGSLTDMTAASTDSTGAIKTLTDALKNYGSGALSARSATRQLESAIDDAEAAFKKNGKTLDVHEEKGRANQAALDGIASAANAAASSTYAISGSSEDAAKKLDEGRSAFIKTAEQMGLTKKKAKELADQLIATPDQVTTSVKLSGVAQAKSDLNALIKQVRAFPSSVGLSIDVDGRVHYSDARNSDGGHAAGGTVGGTGSPFVDSVNTSLAPGEEVTPNPWASVYRKELKQMAAGIYQPAPPAAGNQYTFVVEVPITSSMIADKEGTAVFIRDAVKAGLKSAVISEDWATSK